MGKEFQFGTSKLWWTTGTCGEQRRRVFFYKGKEGLGRACFEQFIGGKWEMEVVTAPHWLQARAACCVQADRTCPYVLSSGCESSPFTAFWLHFDEASFIHFHTANVQNVTITPEFSWMLPPSQLPPLEAATSLHFLFLSQISLTFSRTSWK